MGPSHVGIGPNTKSENFNFHSSLPTFHLLNRFSHPLLYPVSFSQQLKRFAKEGPSMLSLAAVQIMP